MPIRRGQAQWKGTLRDGSGTLRLGSGAFEGSYSFGSRFAEERGTNPEELIGAAHAGCFSMALSKLLADNGHPPERIDTEARVHLEKKTEGFAITRIELRTRAKVPGISADAFRAQAEAAKKGCPVSQALAAVDITLDANLEA